MKSILQSVQLAGAALFLAVSGVQAAVFNFSYTFGDGVIASGSLSGTQNGLYVESISGVSLAFNGIAVPGSIFTSKYDSATFSYLSGPVVSFDVSLNNFLFANSDLAGGDFSNDSLFYIINPGAPTAVGLSIPLGVFGSQDDPAIARNWSLRLAGGATVPDAGSSAALLGFAMLGVVWFRRKLG